MGDVPNVCNISSCNEQPSFQDPNVNILTICNHLQKCEEDNISGKVTGVNEQDCIGHQRKDLFQVKQCAGGSITESIVSESSDPWLNIGLLLQNNEGIHIDKNTSNSNNTCNTWIEEGLGVEPQAKAEDYKYQADSTQDSRETYNTHISSRISSNNKTCEKLQCYSERQDNLKETNRNCKGSNTTCNIPSHSQSLWDRDCNIGDNARSTEIKSKSTDVPISNRFVTYSESDRHGGISGGNEKSENSVILDALPPASWNANCKSEDITCSLDSLLERISSGQNVSNCKIVTEHCEVNCITYDSSPQYEVFVFYPKGQKDVEQLAQDQVVHSTHGSGASSELVDRQDAISFDSQEDNITKAQVWNCTF